MNTDLSADFRQLIDAATDRETLRRLLNTELPHLIGITDTERKELRQRLLKRIKTLFED